MLLESVGIILNIFQARYTDAMKMPKWRVMVVYGVVLLAVGGWYFATQTARNHTEAVRNTIAKTSSKPKEMVPSGVVQFAAMGDMLAHDSVVAQAKTAGGYDFKPYFTNIRPLYKHADAVFCNAEGLTTGAQFGISGYPVFNGPTEFARDLVEGAGCTVINLANNHMNDKGQAAIDANLSVWEALKPLVYGGANRSADEQQRVQYFTKNGVKVAFLAFADYSNNKALTPYGINIYHDTALVKKLVGEARAQADAVIVSAHWGTEDSNMIHPDQTAAAQLFADSGADVVIGTGPHVLQPVQSVVAADGRKTLVWYSIGNMLSSQLKVDELTGVIAGFTLQKQGENKVVVINPTAQVTFMSYDWPMADRAVQKLSTRTKLQLRPLSTSGTAAAEMFGPQYTHMEREQYVRATLGTSVAVTVTP